jgi:hypothetical protein
MQVSKTAVVKFKETSFSQFALPWLACVNQFLFQDAAIPLAISF